MRMPHRHHHRQYHATQATSEPNEHVWNDQQQWQEQYSAGSANEVIITRWKDEREVNNYPYEFQDEHKDDEYHYDCLHD